MKKLLMWHYHISCAHTVNKGAFLLTTMAQTKVVKTCSSQCNWTYIVFELANGHIQFRTNLNYHSRPKHG